ncbi:hypothetical protein [Pseudomonas sp. TH31]|uniref:hypothetical protein n=1 Tax=Pseudomonas sp. TH31 TaxID=2796396 RepID=UPI0019130868|nr:hypothetical protein [Pseudomonas sp. TH31]MBK5416956.1 hypothetical protein [Pseudomonas sp. TH31]
MKTLTLVAAAELREAAFEDEVLAKPSNAACLKDRVAWFYDGSFRSRPAPNAASRSSAVATRDRISVYDGCAAERSLAQLGSCYKGSW